MSIDIESLNIGDQFYIGNGLLTENDIAVYVGTIGDRYEFPTFINGQGHGHMSLDAKQMEENPFNMVKIDSDDPRYIQGTEEMVTEYSRTFEMIMNMVGDE